MSDESISEQELAEKLGVNRDRIRAERPHLGPGEVSQEGHVIRWALGAAARVAKKLGLTFPEEKNAAPAVPASPAHEELTVSSGPRSPGGTHFGNPHLIKAKRATGEEVVVRVLHPAKFMPRLRTGSAMTIKAQKSASGNWWTLVGREPRFPGQW